MVWIILIIIIAIVWLSLILFVRSTARGRPKWLQEELDEEQMRVLDEMQKKKQLPENNSEEQDN